MPNKTTITGIYDIATAFITDRNTQVSADCSKYGIRYTFTKRGLADYPYCMVIRIPRDAPEYNCHYALERKCGEVYLHRGSATTDIYHERTLLSATTKHNVGRANDNTQRDIVRVITRILSPRFFKLANMAEKRLRGEIQTTDNTAQLFNMIYRIKQK